jgi:hypothetical protein
VIDCKYGTPPFKFPPGASGEVASQNDVEIVTEATEELRITHLRAPIGDLALTASSIGGTTTVIGSYLSPPLLSHRLELNHDSPASQALKEFGNKCIEHSPSWLKVPYPWNGELYDTFEIVDPLRIHTGNVNAPRGSG